MKRWLFSAFLLIGCGGDDTSGAISVAMTCSPSSGAAGATITASITAENFEFVAPTDPPSANVEGEGHYHIYLDNNTGTNYLAASIAATTPVVIGAPTAGWTVGAHTLKVVLNNNDHSEVANASATCAVTVN